MLNGASLPVRGVELGFLEILSLLGGVIVLRGGIRLIKLVFGIWVLLGQRFGKGGLRGILELVEKTISFTLKLLDGFVFFLKQLLMALLNILYLSFELLS